MRNRNTTANDNRVNGGNSTANGTNTNGANTNDTGEQNPNITERYRAHWEHQYDRALREFRNVCTDRQRE